MIDTIKSFKTRGKALLTALAIALPIQTAQAHAFTPNTHAVWVYEQSTLPNPVTDPIARQTLIDNSAASGVNMIYLSVYSSTPNSASRLMYDETALSDLIVKAHAKGIQVYAAYGAPDWPSLGCSTTSGGPTFPLQRMAEIVSYNATHPSGIVNNVYVSPTFDGVILDIEPAGTPDFQALLGMYQCFQQKALANNIGLSAAISAFWNTSITYGGVTKEAYKQIVDLNLNQVVVMGYRNLAGTFTCPVSDGLICLDENAVAYATSLGKGSTILVGLETINPVAAGILDKETFYGPGQAVLNYEAQSVYNQFNAANLSFGGFAIHNYQESYLSGQITGFPATNLDFPRGAFSPPVVQTPTGTGVSTYPVNIGSTSINVLFPSVRVAGNTTFSQIDPTMIGTGPTGYQLSNGLAFDISTTAVCTGPVSVCFRVPSVDPSTFSTLRVLHNSGAGFIDQTILSGALAPDPVTETICASVSSFSPFVLAHLHQVNPVIPFAAFSVQIPYADSHIFLEQGTFTLGGNARINPVTDAVTFTLGSTSIKIPAGSFAQLGKSTVFLVDRTVNGVRLDVAIYGRNGGNTQYDFIATGNGLDLTRETEPLSVGLQIGNNAGTTTVHANIHH